MKLLLRRVSALRVQLSSHRQHERPTFVALVEGEFRQCISIPFLGPEVFVVIVERQLVLTVRLHFSQGEGHL